MEGISSGLSSDQTRSGAMLRSLEYLATLLGPNEAEIVTESWIMAEDVAFRKLVDGGTPKYVDKATVHHYVCYELWTRWFRQQQFNGTPNPAILLPAPGNQHVAYARFHDDVARQEYVNMGTAMIAPWEALRELGDAVGGAHLYQPNLEEAVYHIHNMEAFRLGLWNELRPHQKPYPGCGPWAVPLSGEGFDLTSFAIGQNEFDGLPNYRRAQLLLDNGRRLFLRCRQIQPGVEGSGLKLVLVLPPFVKSLGIVERIALLEAWELIQSWYFSLRRGQAITLLDFIRNRREEELLAVSQRKVEEVEDLGGQEVVECEEDGPQAMYGWNIAGQSLSSADLRQEDIKKEE